MGSFLFLPSAKPGNGTGHLVRAFRTAAELVEPVELPSPHTHDQPVVNIFIPAEQMRPGIERLLEKYPQAASLLLTDAADLGSGKWDFTVWDRRTSTAGEYDRWKDIGIPIGIDEGGELRDRFALLIDTFPLPPRFGVANLSDPGFLPRPEHTRELPAGEFPEVFKKILISFGGEDPAGLTEKTLGFLLDRAKRPPKQITVVLGPLFGEREPAKAVPEGIEVLRSPENLAEQLHRYDLVCTSFGLTAYEAVSAGTGVLLVNPSEYHTELSRQAGFPVAGTGEIDPLSFIGFLENPAELLRAAREVRPRGKLRLSDYLAGLQVPEVKACPFCGSSEGCCLARFEGRTFYRCRKCGLVYQQNFHAGVGDYGEDYFFSEYREHYGRTYLEDFESLRALARPRIERIKSRAVKTGRLLDVGCAYGPFLLEAHTAGFEGTGLDVVAGATDYVRKELGIPAVCSSFEEYDPGESSYDVITMWYVIEHFADLGKVLEKVNYLLRNGGIFAFSSPNIEGITGRGRYGHFLGMSPEDHHTVWSAEIAESVLGRAGFSIEKTVNTGHHPERFRFSNKTGHTMVSSLIGVYSRLMKLGDSFEVYARKTGGFNVR